MRTEKQLFNDDASTEALRIYAQETSAMLAFA